MAFFPSLLPSFLPPPTWTVERDSTLAVPLRVSTQKTKSIVNSGTDVDVDVGAVVVVGGRGTSVMVRHCFLL